MKVPIRNEWDRLWPCCLEQPDEAVNCMQHVLHSLEGSANARLVAGVLVFSVDILCSSEERRRDWLCSLFQGKRQPLRPLTTTVELGGLSLDFYAAWSAAHCIRCSQLQSTVWPFQFWPAAINYLNSVRRHHKLAIKYDLK